MSFARAVGPGTDLVKGHRPQTCNHSGLLMATVAPKVALNTKVADPCT